VIGNPTTPGRHIFPVSGQGLSPPVQNALSPRLSHNARNVSIVGGEVESLNKFPFQGLPRKAL